MIHIVQFCTPKVRNEGLRLGTVRMPPRGVPKKRYQALHIYDVFFPIFAPSKWLFGYRDAEWPVFRKHFLSEMKLSAAPRLLDVFAQLSREPAIGKRETIIAAMLGSIPSETAKADAKRMRDVLPMLATTLNFSIGCYCKTEDGCHRSILRELLEQRGAKLSPAPK